jgi:starch synthase
VNSVKEIWIFSFECAGVVKFGGLGEAVYNIAKHLARREFKVTLFTPSHGVHESAETEERLQLRDTGLSIRGKAKEGRFMPYRNPFRYNIGALKGYLDGFNVIIFYGLDKRTSQVLDDPVVYRAEGIEDKALLLTRGVLGFVENLDALGQAPADVIHAHDYHAVPAAVLVKQRLNDRNLHPALMLTVHLLSEKRVSWNYLGEDWCGIEDRPHPVHFLGERKKLTHRQVLRKAKHKLEAFAAIEAGTLASVSQTYLQEAVMKRVGFGCEDKATFHWNGCDWSMEAMLKETTEKFGKDIEAALGTGEINRWSMRRYFLTKAIGNLKAEEPVLDEGKVKEFLGRFRKNPFLEQGKVEPFSEDGPLVLMTGRLTEQKGVGTLFRSIPGVLAQIPDAKFVLLMLPIEEEANLVERYAKLTAKYTDSVRIIFGRAPSIYALAHLSADVFTCPSEWEPFGIMALEAMATGNPVVATSVGGLREIVVDARENPRTGTGLVVGRRDHKALTEAIVSLVSTMRFSEVTQQKGTMEQAQRQELLNHIHYESVRNSVASDSSYGLMLRDNALKRVEESFRWSKVISMVIDAYQKASNVEQTLI